MATETTHRGRSAIDATPDEEFILRHFRLEGEQIVRVNPRRAQDRIVKGTLNGKGYLQASAGKRGVERIFLLHRVKFFLINGYLPHGEHSVDHFPDRTKTNNLGSNLRDATYSEQNANRAPYLWHRNRH